MLKCEIGGCFRQPVEKAHINSKGSGGSKKPHNIIDLCVYHHRLSQYSLDHNKGVWWFADHFGLRERFERAFEAEREIERGKRDIRITKFKQRQAESRKRYCPTCKRRWGKGEIRK